MTLRQLHFFLGVLRAGSFTRAAGSLHVAQPAIGVQIAALEEELGVKLLTRHSRGVTPTEAGELLARRAAGLVGDAERLRRDIMDMGREPRGRIALGLTGTAVRLFGARLAQTCRRAYPDLDLTVTEAMGHRLADSLARGQLDAAVTSGPPAGSDAVSESLATETLATEALATETLYFVAPAGHALAGGSEIPLGAALEADLVLPPRPSMVRRLVRDAARANGAALRPVFETGSVAMILDMVLIGGACTVLPYGAVRREVEDGNLAALRIVEPRLTRTLYLTCSENRPGAKALDAVRGEIRTLAAELIDGGAAGWAAPH